MSGSVGSSAKPESDRDVFAQPELAELRNNLARLSGPSVEDYYRAAYRECAVERKPGGKAMQRLVSAGKVLGRWGWK